MLLYKNTIQNRQALCAGCRQTIDQGQGYLQLELNDEDGSLQGFGWDHAEFHTEKCVAMMIRYAYAWNYAGIYYGMNALRGKLRAWMQSWREKTIPWSLCNEYDPQWRTTR